LVEKLVRLDVKRVREGVPHDLIDADDAMAIVTIFIVAIAHKGCIAIALEADQKHRLAGHGRYVDRAIEWDRQPRFDVEAVEGVDHGEVVALGLAHSAVGNRQVDSPLRVMARVSDRELIAWERATSGGIQTEPRLHTCENERGT